MNSEQQKVIGRYEELYADMATAKDPKKMKTFGEAEKWVFRMVADKHPELAEAWLTKLEAGRWFNYLSRAEAEAIVGRLIGQDGTRGAHWSYDAFKVAVESLGGKACDEPFYNYCALWVTVQMLYSDHHRSVSKYVPEDKELCFLYDMAVEKLKDPDRPKFVREYFSVG